MKRRALESYYKAHESAKKRYREKYKFLRQNLIDRRSLQKLVASTIAKKYNKLNNSVRARTTGYIYKLIRNASKCKLPLKRMEADHLVRSSLCYRDIHCKQFMTSFKKLRTTIIATLVKVLELTKEDETHEVLLGASMHTASTESYFPGSSYHSAALDTNGKVILSKFPLLDNSGMKINKSTAWACSSELCKLEPKADINKFVCDIYSSIGECNPLQARNFIQHIDDCCRPDTHDPKLKGHSEECHLDVNACSSKLLYLRRLAPHFPFVRRLVNMIYNVKRSDNKICGIDRALQKGDVLGLKQIVKEQKHARKSIRVLCCSIDESEIYKEFGKAFEAYNDRSSDLPEFPCMSCTMLCYKRDCSQVRLCKKPISGTAWEQLNNHLEHNPAPDDGLPSGYICHYCLGKFRSGTMSPRCMLNGLCFDFVPTEILKLNQHERVLIQRAKAFQVVTKMQTVAGKRLPPSHKVSKVHGSTFHLPLPLHETLKRLPNPEYPLPESGELYILLRSIPTTKKVLWQDMVDVNKIYAALSKLKEINPLYAAINLPSSASGLELDKKLSTCVITDPAVDDNESNGHAKDLDSDQLADREPMVRRIQDDEETELYQDYTIHALHAPRENEKATALYQLLRINEPALSAHYKQLDLLCFPDLFPQGYGGLHHNRNFPLPKSDYVKVIFMSRYSKFRRNLQFFFHLHQANLRQISGGIYHKLKIMRPHEKLTAGRYLEMLEKEEIEGNLTSVFSRLRNSEQYWIRPRNELNAMAFHYGPATWYLTLSPSEWSWHEMGDYLRKLNPDLSSLSISALVAADPISTSRFIDNKLKAFLEFITSDCKPIGEVTHYYYRREYQGRGLQHFHFQIWVKDAPVIDVDDDKTIAKFIAQYCTCSIPDKILSPVLHERVVKYQSHHCNNYCMRQKKTQTGFRKVCRFGFPRPTRDTMHLRSVVESVAGRKTLRENSRLYDLPRQHNERMINDYNPAVLLAWEGNMDIQFVGEKSSILNWYITKYTTKAEKSHAKTAFTELTSNKSVASRLWNIALRSLSHRECGALEASDTLLGIQLYGTDPSTVFRWVDINMVRSRRVKEYHVINTLPEDSEDILYRSLVDSYYPNRPTELEDINLYDFLAWHDIESKQPKENHTFYPLFDRFLKRRSSPYLINHYRYNPEQEPEKYFYSLLLLFKPW